MINYGLHDLIYYNLHGQILDATSMKPSEKLAQSLTLLRMIQEKGIYAIQSKDLSRTHRERLNEYCWL